MEKLNYFKISNLEKVNSLDLPSFMSDLEKMLENSDNLKL